MLRRTLLALAIALLLPASSFAAANKVMIVTWRGCEEACKGLQDYVSEKTIDAETILRDAARDKTRLPSFLKEARDHHVDLIVTWGTSVTRGIAGTMEQLNDPSFNHDIAQVFMIVADPVGSGVVKSLDATGRSNLTGTYNRVPEEVNIETMRTYLPSFHHLGMLFNANEPNSVVKRDEVARVAKGQGIAFTAVELPLGSEGKPQIQDIEPKLGELKAAGTDFIYIGSSSFLETNGDALAEAAVKTGLPVLSPYEELVRNSHALISVAARYYEVGQLAGEQIKKILVDGATPGDLPVLRMTDFAVVVNLAMARKLKLYPPVELLQIAETVN